MQPNDKPPEWAMKIEVPQAPGVTPPAAPMIAQAGLTEPDGNGHQWILLMLGDGTVSITLRMPWQTSIGFGQAIANMLTQLAAQANAKAGPSLIVPPPGTQLPDLGINGRNPLNGNGRH